jgi:hypothetical protein
MATVDRAAPETDLDRLCVDTIRGLAIDGVQRANSGHPDADGNGPGRLSALRPARSARLLLERPKRARRSEFWALEQDYRVRQPIPHDRREIWALEQVGSGSVPRPCDGTCPTSHMSAAPPGVVSLDSYVMSKLTIHAWVKTCVSLNRQPPEAPMGTPGAPAARAGTLGRVPYGPFTIAFDASDATVTSMVLIDRVQAIRFSA